MDNLREGWLANRSFLAFPGSEGSWFANEVDDEAYRGLQIALMLRPEQGPVIRGGGGVRKVRWPRPGAGKSGGMRVICYWAPGEEAFYMLYAYAKNEQGDLTAAQTRALGQLVREEFK